MGKKIILLILFQVLVLTFMAISHFAIELYGEEVRLKTAPVDPRDILYGDYVILNYEISDIDISKFTGETKLEQGDTVYVLLKKQGTYHQLVSAHLQKPTASSDEQVLKGRVGYLTQNWDPVLGENSEITAVRVVYGFERYYVPEGAGKELEDKRGQFDVVVKVTPWGQSLSSLKFIANNVMTQGEVQERVYDHYRNQSIPIEITRSHLEEQYQNQQRPVWIIEVTIYEDKNQGSEGNKTSLLVVDAKTGEILEQKSH